MATELYIISDLHLCDGGPRDDFDPVHDDQALAGFLDHITAQPGVSLLINGDFIDFVQIQPRTEPPMWSGDHLDASEAESLEKLEQAIKSHSKVFDALGRFVRSGHELRFHYGNHDIDLIWPQVQQRIRERLIDQPDHAAITFGDSWEQGGLYVEHGHQADKANSFPAEGLIQRDAQGIERLHRCWGTRLVEEFFNKVEELPDCDMLDNVRPRLDAVFLLLKHAIRTPSMYPMLKDAIRIIIQTTAGLKSTDDARNAGDQLGLTKPWQAYALFTVAGFFRMGKELKAAWGGQPGTLAMEDGSEVGAAELDAAYAQGEQIQDPETLAALLEQQAAEHGGAPDPALTLALEDPFELAKLFYDTSESQKYIHRAAKIAQERFDLQVLCFGHTHQGITQPYQIDKQAGWPLPDSRARFYNSGSWTSTLDLQRASEQLSFAYLKDRSNYRAGRDYIHVTWPGPATPHLELQTWEA